MSPPSAAGAAASTASTTDLSFCLTDLFSEDYSRSGHVPYMCRKGDLFGIRGVRFSQARLPLCHETNNVKAVVKNLFHYDLIHCIQLLCLPC